MSLPPTPVLRTLALIVHNQQEQFLFDCLSLTQVCFRGLIGCYKAVESVSSASLSSTHGWLCSWRPRTARRRGRRGRVCSEDGYMSIEAEYCQMRQKCRWETPVNSSTVMGELKPLSSTLPIHHPFFYILLFTDLHMFPCRLRWFGGNKAGRCFAVRVDEPGGAVLQIDH